MSAIRDSKGKYRAVLDAVRFLRDEYGCSLAKFSTEDEGLTHDAVRARSSAFGRIVEIELKIGGAGARGDMALCRDEGIGFIIVPMVESPYALHDFLTGAIEIFGKDFKAKVGLGMNVETGIAVENLSRIFAEAADNLTQVTVGRSDLSKSLGVGVNSAIVRRMSARVIKLAKARGYRTSMGGGVEPEHVRAAVTACGPDAFNTRNFAFEVKKLRAGKRLELAARDALLAEILLCRANDMPGASMRKVALKARLGATKLPIDPKLARIFMRAGESAPC